LDIARKIVESIDESEGAEASEFARIIAEVVGVDDAEKFVGASDPSFAGVAVGTLAEVTGWFEGNGYSEYTPGAGASQTPSSQAWVNQDKGVIATIQPAFGNVITAGFADAPTSGRREPERRIAPDAGEYDGTMPFPGSNGMLN